LDKQTLGTFSITVELTDLEGKRSSYPIVIEVDCGTTTASKLCAPKETAASTATAATTTTADVTGPATAAVATTTAAFLDEVLDYEVKVVLSVSEQVVPVDPDLQEDEDFEDIPGIITSEQAASIIDNIETALDVATEDVKFDETLIPTGALETPSEEEAALMTPDELDTVQAYNEIAVASSRKNAQIRL